MPYVVIITKQGQIKELNLKEFHEDVLYKKAGFSSPNGFHCIKRDCWKITHKGKDYVISVYGKVDGRAGQENQYDLPPPLDIPTEAVKLPFFGGLVLVNSKQSVDNTNMYTMDSIRAAEWLEIYSKLLDGFDDLCTVSLEDEEDDEEEERVPAHLLDKNGYKKDGFIVDTDEEDEDHALEFEDGLDNSESASESEEEKKPKRKVKQRNTILPKMLKAVNKAVNPKPVRRKAIGKKPTQKAAAAAAAAAAATAAVSSIDITVENEPFDLDSELVEEEYFS